MVTYKEVGLMFLAFLLKMDPNGFKEPVKTQNGNDLFDVYDFIIVGGGSAGSTLANRLSEVESWKILLLEAGGQENVYTKTPIMFSNLMNSQYDWNYTTTTQSRSCQATNGQCIYPRGRLLGGSSGTNAMIYTRGYRSDYDKWGRDNHGWSFKNLEPYFQKLEDYRFPESTRHGKGGPLTVSMSTFKTELRDKIIQAGVRNGMQNRDCPDYESDCIFETRSTIRDGRRCSASVAYLEPISQERKNLHIVTNAIVTKIIINDNVAKGVEFTYNSKKLTVLAEKEVVLSAGAINSPKLLMLSGIGQKAHLNSLGIAVVADLPVGDNFQDHNRVPLFFNMRKGSVTNIDDLANPANQQQYLHNQTGPFSYSGVEVLGFIRRGWLTKLRRDPPNVQYHITTEVGRDPYLLGISTTVLRPKSIGTIRLKSSDPMDDPLINVNYYDNNDDWKLTLDGLRYSYDLANTKPISDYGGSLNKTQHPLCAGISDLNTYFQCVIENYTGTMYHPVGTVKMGTKNNGGVVNSDLHVYGVKNLRVIDASIPPTIISMNTNAMAIMIAEKGADLIKSDHK